MKHGFTLIEQMIAITVIGILITMGASAYAQARERQAGQSAVELIISTLQSNQTLASIGKKDCDGKFIGQEVNLTVPNTITAHAVCENEQGADVITSVPDITFAAPSSLMFKPLSLGIDLGTPSSETTLSFTSTAQLIYQVKVTSSGTIEYLGIQ
jgi:prepilin-type N-terminal cleavage/methylation domain-containing protein